MYALILHVGDGRVDGVAMPASEIGLIWYIIRYGLFGERVQYLES